MISRTRSEPNEELAMRENIPRRGQPMPYVEQDLVREIIGGTDQRHLSVPHNINGALIAIRDVIAWTDKHKPTHPHTALQQGCEACSTVETTPESSGGTDASEARTSPASEECNKRTDDRLNAQSRQNLGRRWRGMLEAVKPVCNPNGHEGQDENATLRTLEESIAKITRDDGPKRELGWQAICEGLEQIYKEVAQIAITNAETSKGEKKALIYEANSNGTQGYKMLFRRLRANQAPPCSLLRIGDNLTGNMSKIHEEFASRWEPVFNRLKHNPPNYDDFASRYGKYIKCTEAGDRLPNAQDLHEAARRSKGTAAGIDGWLPADRSTPHRGMGKKSRAPKGSSGQW